MGRFIAGSIAVIIVIGSILILGIIIGGAWNAGMSDEGGANRDEVEACLPTETIEELELCLEAQ